MTTTPVRRSAATLVIRMAVVSTLSVLAIACANAMRYLVPSFPVKSAAEIPFKLADEVTLPGFSREGGPGLGGRPLIPFQASGLGLLVRFGLGLDLGEALRYLYRPVQRIQTARAVGARR